MGTSSAEAAHLRLIPKMEHLGVSKSVVGLTVPTGHLITLLALMIIASKVAAGVAGAGLATLACGLGTCRPDLVNGVGVIVGIDRFSSEARAVTNFTGNAVATVLIGRWTSQIDVAQVRAVVSGERRCHEATMAGTDGYGGGSVLTTHSITVFVRRGAIPVGGVSPIAALAPREADLAGSASLVVLL